MEAETPGQPLLEQGNPSAANWARLKAGLSRSIPWSRLMSPMACGVGVRPTRLVRSRQLQKLRWQVSWASKVASLAPILPSNHQRHDRRGRVQAAIPRPVGAFLLERSDEWGAERARYLPLATAGNCQHPR